VRADAHSVLWLVEHSHGIVTKFRKRVIIEVEAVCGKRKLEGHADSLIRRSVEGAGA